MIFDVLREEGWSVGIEKNIYIEREKERGADGEREKRRAIKIVAMGRDDLF